MTRAPCRRRTGEDLPRAEKFGDLITANHKVLNMREVKLESNHRYAVVVQDLATQWIQSYPCKTKTSQETEKEFTKVPRAVTQTKSHLHRQLIHWNLGKSCEDLSWNHRTSTPHRSETNGIAERAVRRVKEGTSAVLLQSGLDEKWWADSMECYCFLRNVQDLVGRWENSVWKTIWRTIQRANNSFWSNGWKSSDFSARSIKTSSIWQESVTWYLSWEISREEFGKEIFWLRILEDLEKLDASEIYPRRINAKEVLISQKKEMNQYSQ